MRCMAALTRAREACRDLADTELIVADDGCSDDSPAWAEVAGARVVTTTGRTGPGAARNLAAQHATGDVLMFVDADVVVHEDTLRTAVAAFLDAPTLVACFGSYDDRPAAPNFLSQYRNLMHHYVHQHSSEQASSFWAGCGAIRADVFREVGGFDEKIYGRPSIEDIELGYRIRHRGGPIRLLKHMQCTHLKRWDALGVLRTDIRDRGIPWTRLLWREGARKRGLVDLVRREGQAEEEAPLLDLNLKPTDRMSAAAAAGMAMSALATPVMPFLVPVTLALGASLLVLNRDLYLFFLHQRGARFAAQAITWHWVFQLCNCMSFTAGTTMYLVHDRRRLIDDGRDAATHDR